MFELATPSALLLLFVPFLVWGIVPHAQRTLTSALKVPFFAAIQTALQREHTDLKIKSTFVWPLCIFGVLTLALAGPCFVGEPLLQQHEGYNILMALDLSGSMEVEDMQLHGKRVSRLAVVKRAAKEFVNARSGDSIGLILFGSQAYVQTPLTLDRHNVLARLDDATVGLAGKTTSIGDAVGLAVKRFMDAPKQGRVIILLTDGASNSGMLSPMQAAALARDEGIKIYTIGLGAESDEQAMTLDNFFNNGTSADLDEETLKKMAALTEGQYFRATNLQSLQDIYQTINKLEKTQKEEQNIRPRQEYYPWLVGLALILCAMWAFSYRRYA